MRFLADENISLPTIRVLRASGLDVESIAELSPGTPDEQVLAYAREQNQVLITFDRDFGELVYHRGAPVPPESFIFVSPRTIPHYPPGQSLNSQASGRSSFWAGSR
jgi:hypothetical protein